MIIDFHTHIFSQDIRDHREKYFHDPAFELLYRHPNSKLASAEDLIRCMDEQHVDKSVVFGFPWKDSRVFQQENDYILEATSYYSDRLIGFCCFDPMSSDAISETIRCLESGCLGVGELAFYDTGIDSKCLDMLAPIMEICADKKVPVLIHTNESVGHIYPGKSPITLREIYALIRRFPNNVIVLAHWGGGILFYRLLKREVKESFTNIYFDTAASPYLYDPSIYKIAVELEMGDKILFGSDFPLIKPDRYMKEMTNSGLLKQDIDAMMGNNAEKILKASIASDSVVKHRR